MVDGASVGTNVGFFIDGDTDGVLVLGLVDDGFDVGVFVGWFVEGATVGISVGFLGVRLVGTIVAANLGAKLGDVEEGSAVGVGLNDTTFLKS